MNILSNINQFPVVCIDTETTGLQWTQHRVFGVAIAVPNCPIEQLIGDPVGAPIEALYFDVRRRHDMYKMLQGLAPRIPLVVNHNIKFDAHMLLNDDVKLDVGHAECTMIRASLINEHLRDYSLNSLTGKYLKINKAVDIYEKLSQMFGGFATRNAQMKNLYLAPPELVAPYATTDAEIALRLWAWQEQEIKKQDLYQVWNLEKTLFPRIFKMERDGIRVDVEKAERQVDQLTVKINALQKDLNMLAGFNVNSNPSGSLLQLFDPKQINGKYYSVDGTFLESTSTGKPSIDANALRKMKHPAAKLVLSLRKLTRTRDTFINGHILGHHKDGRIYPNINQVKGDETGGTGTGRISYTLPALQQIPNRDKEIAAIVRPVFLPEIGHGWTYGDLDQHELRIFHHYVNNPKIVESYRKNPNLDGHQIVADLIRLPRNPPASGGANAKQMNLAMVFNMGGGELADKMGMPFTVESFIDKHGESHQFKKAGPEAQKIIDAYYEMIPGIKEISTKARSIAKSRGYVKTLMGRHIRFPGGMFTYKASGLVYQGSSADLNKDNIIRIHEYLQSECPEARMLLNIHDEFSISLPLDGKEDIHRHGLQSIIQNRPEIRIPLRIDFSKPSRNWWEATVGS